MGGVKALFRSMPTTLAMNMPFGTVLVASNESLKQSMGLDQPSAGRMAFPLYFASAGISGALAAMATHPLDVIKTRMQTQNCLDADTRSASGAVAPGQGTPQLRPKYDGFVKTLQTIVREEGAWALTRGLVPRVLYTMPGAGLCWGTYEGMKSLL